MAKRPGNKRQLLTMVLVTSALAPAALTVLAAAGVAAAVTTRRQTPSLQITIYEAGAKEPQGPGQAQPPQGPAHTQSTRPPYWLIALGLVAVGGVVGLVGQAGVALFNYPGVWKILDVPLTTIGATLVSLSILIGALPAIRWWSGKGKGIEIWLSGVGSAFLTAAAWLAILKPHDS